MLLAAGIATALALTAILVRTASGTRPPASLSRRPASLATPLPPEVAARRLLDARARAILRHDRAGFLATIDPSRTAYYRTQSKVFGWMTTVPFSAFSYRIVDASDLATLSLQRRYAPDDIYLAEVEARYRFRGQDASPVLAHFSFTFAQTPAGWRIAAQGEAQPPASDDVEIWDAGPVQTISTARTLVAFHPGGEQLARRLLAAAERGYAQVGRSWASPWDDKVVILVPRDQHEAERLVGASDLSGVAAVAASSIESGPVDRVLGNRIVVNTTNLADYDTLNLQVVITHEMTHVATRTLGGAAPLLLVEGFADYVALRPVRLPFAVTRPALAKAVRLGTFTGVLPSDAQFRGAGDASVAYDEGSAFCQWVADAYGDAKLQALYRAFGAPSPGGRAQDAVFGKVLGISLQRAEARWAAYVRRRL